MSEDRIKQAIAIIESSRETHVDWADWLKEGNEEGNKYLDDEAFHRQCIKDYDYVLEVLRDKDKK